MKRLRLLGLFVMAVILCAPVLSHAQGYPLIHMVSCNVNSGDSIYAPGSNDTGVSLIAKYDQKSVNIRGFYAFSLGTILLGYDTSDPGATGGTAASGATVPVKYIALNDDLTTAQFETLFSSTQYYNLLSSVSNFQISGTSVQPVEIAPDFARFVYVCITNEGATSFVLPSSTAKLLVQ